MDPHSPSVAFSLFHKATESSELSHSGSGSEYLDALKTYQECSYLMNADVFSSSHMISGYACKVLLQMSECYSHSKPSQCDLTAFGRNKLLSDLQG